jgi:hypothetical protein
VLLQDGLAAGSGPWLKRPWPTGGSVYWGLAAMGSTLAAGRAQRKPADRYDCYGALRQVENCRPRRPARQLPRPLGRNRLATVRQVHRPLALRGQYAQASSTARNRAQCWRANFKFRTQVGLLKRGSNFKNWGAALRTGWIQARPTSHSLTGHQPTSASRHRSGTPSSNRCIALSASGVGSASRLTR